jgi:hypothetical protein
MIWERKEETPGVKQEEDDSQGVGEMRHIRTTIEHQEQQIQTILAAGLMLQSEQYNRLATDGSGVIILTSNYILIRATP